MRGVCHPMGMNSHDFRITVDPFGWNVTFCKVSIHAFDAFPDKRMAGTPQDAVIIVLVIFSTMILYANNAHYTWLLPHLSSTTATPEPSCCHTSTLPLPRLNPLAATPQPYPCHAWTLLLPHLNLTTATPETFLLPHLNLTTATPETLLGLMIQTKPWKGVPCFCHVVLLSSLASSSFFCCWKNMTS